jgi:hypothetical protein
MNKHTPGPWNYSEGCVSATDNGDYIILAEVHSTFGTDNFGEETLMSGPIEREANGRLIAAAPDMCALLGNLAAACDGWDDDWENDEQRADEFWHMARAAKVLLAEIEGGNNE